MNIAETTETTLRYLVGLLLLALLVKLWRSRLFSRYRIFTTLIATLLIQTAITLPFSTTSNTYAWIYIWTEPPVWIIYYCVIYELSNVALRYYKGIARLSRAIITTGFLISLVFAAIDTAEHSIGSYRTSAILNSFQAFHRAAGLGTVVFLCFLIYLLFWYPLRLNQNALVFCIGYTVFFVNDELTLSAISLFKAHPFVLDALNLSITALCILFWVTRLSPEGDDIPSHLGKDLSDEQHQELLHHLESIERLLKQSMPPDR